MTALRLDGIRLRYGNTEVLRGVSLDIAPGEFLTLLGPSGCGKSSLLRIIAGLEPQDAGSVTLGGRVVDGLPPKARDIAMVFQSYALYPHMTVAQNMALPLRMRRMTRWQRLPLLGRLLPGTGAARRGVAADVAQVAEALDIGPLLARKPGQLSGGQRQRVALGRAMVRRPAVFLMDEPLSNLDAKLRVALRAEIADLHRRLGATFVYVTHDQSEAMTMSDRVAVMQDGRILQVAPPAVLYADPVDIGVAAFVGSPRINLLDATATPQGLRLAGGTDLPLTSTTPPGTALRLGLRPEALALVPAAGPGIISAAVRLVEHTGSDTYLHLGAAAAAEPLILRAEAGVHATVTPGMTVHAKVLAAQALLFAADGSRLRVAAPRRLAVVAP